MSFLLKIENIAKSSKILISGELFFLRSKDRSRTHDQKLKSKATLSLSQYHVIQEPRVTFQWRKCWPKITHNLEKILIYLTYKLEIR